MINLSKYKHLRTVFLAVLATCSFVASAIWVFDVEARIMLQFFLISLFGLGIIVLMALCFTACRLLLARFLKR